MKKLLTILAIASATTFLHAQGLVYIYGNAKFSTNTAVSVYNNGPGTGGVGGLTAAPSSGQIYNYALLYASGAAPGLSAAALTSSWTFSGLTATNYLAAGYVAGTGGSGGAAAAGWAAGATENVVIVGWSANLGDTWATVATELANNSWAANGFFGVSGIGSVTSGGANNVPATSVFGNSGIAPGSLTLYSVSPVPEPTTIALIGIGGLGLAMIRRRK